MTKDSLKKVATDISRKVNEHGPEIAIGCGVLGMTVAAIDAIRVTPKALVLLEEKKEELDVDELKPKEIIETTWKCYILPVVVGVASATCILGASKTNWKKKTAMATAYTITETRLSDYQKKAVELLGDEGEKQIRDAISKEKVEHNPVQNVIIKDTTGENVCYDTISCRYFKSDKETIRKIVNDLNYQLTTEGYVSLNDLYFELGLDPSSIGESLGWLLEYGPIDIDFSSHLDANGTPCLVVDYKNLPVYF